MGRLWNASSPSTYGWRNYTYDGLGNILRMNRSMNGARNDLSYTYDIGGEGGNFGTYRLMSVSSSASGTIRSYTYDARGQPTTIYNPAHGSATYYYEQDGLLVKNSAGSLIKCRYDAFSRRVYVDDVADSFDRTKLHVFTGNSVVYDPEEKMTPKTHQTCYVYADGLFIGKVYGPSSKPSQYKAYVHLDHLGSVRVIIGEEGTAQFSARYEPYGKLWSSSGNWKSSLKYIQRVRDGASGGLYCLGVRFYDGDIGRFISEDPVLGSLSSPLTINRYSYSICDPINGKDPDGDFFFLLFIAAIVIGGAIGGGSYAATHWGEEWDYGDLGRSIAIGAAAGAISVVLPGSGIAAAAAIGAGTGAGLYAADRTIEWAQTGTFEWDWADFGLSVGIGAFAGGVGKAIGNYFGRSMAGESGGLLDRFAVRMFGGSSGLSPATQPGGWTRATDFVKSFVKGGPRNYFGIGDWNTGSRLAIGVLKSDTKIVIKPASSCKMSPIGFRPGGGPELKVMDSDFAFKGVIPFYYPPKLP